MKVLARSNDIRSINRQTFKLNTFYEDYLQEFENESNGPAGNSLSERSPRQKLVRRNYKK